jgi:hypothetical protein
VAFLFLIYIIALVTLFGAHLTSAIDHLQKKTGTSKPQQATTEQSANPAPSDQLASKSEPFPANTSGSNTSGDRVAEADPASSTKPGKEQQVDNSDSSADLGKPTKYPAP